MSLEGEYNGWDDGELQSESPVKQADICVLQTLLAFMQEAASEKSLQWALGNWIQRGRQPSAKQKSQCLSLLDGSLSV